MWDLEYCIHVQLIVYISCFLCFLCLLSLGLFRVGIRQLKNEGLQFASLMMLLSSVVRQLLSKRALRNHVFILIIIIMNTYVIQFYHAYGTDIMKHIYPLYWKRAMTRIQMSDRFASLKLYFFICISWFLTKLLDLFQAAVYGLGVCAEFGGSVFKPLVGGKCCIMSWMNKFLVFCINCIHLWFSPEALSRLNVVIRNPNAQQPENVMAYDNAVSALGKICQFHRDRIDSAQVLKYFLLIFHACWWFC